MRLFQHGHRDEWTDDDGRVVVWTDGGCEDEGAGRLAGAGVFYGVGNQRNEQLQVHGAQTAGRAELAALTRVLETDMRPLSVRIDCLGVVRGYNEFRGQKTGKSHLCTM